MADKLRVRLLGGFEASLGDGNALALKGRKTQALLAVLALSAGIAISREKLTSLLWSDRGDEQARGSLRQALAGLRRALGEDDSLYIVAERDSVTLDAKQLDCDVVALEQLVSSGAADNLEQAAELYRGDLLDGIGITDPSFEVWLAGERSRLSELAQRAMNSLLEKQTEAGEVDKAVSMARRLLALDPMQEQVHRALMCLYAGQGDRAMALKQFQACRDVLKTELGIDPEAETQTLHEEIRQGGDVPITATPNEPPQANLTLPDKPSIAVLPFVNMSGDPEQEYFSDGITEDIITELSRFHSLFVIARNSSFAFKEEAVNISEVGRKLGVQYVVEGSVRKAGNRVRITAQLIEVATGNHVWAERYDRDLDDIFAVQDEVVREIATAVPGQLDVAALNIVQRRSGHNFTAYEYVLRGELLLGHDWGSVESRPLFEAAIEADPLCAKAYAHLSNWHSYSILAHCAPADEAREITRSLAEKALQIEPNDPYILALLAEGYLMAGDLDPARKCIEKAIKLNSNYYIVMIYAADVLAWLGDIDEALRWRELCVLHDPLSGASMTEVNLEVFYLAERYDDAINAISGWHNTSIHLIAEFAATYAQAGQIDQAVAMREQFEARVPDGYTIKNHVDGQLRMCALQKHRDLWLEGYRKAGFDV